MIHFVEEERVRRATSGDRSAFDAIAREHAPALLAFLKRLLARDAEDVLQRTLVKAWTAMPRFDPARPLRPWLLTIALNEARKEHRSRRPTPLLEDVAMEEPLPAEVTHRRNLGERVVALPAELPDEQRAAMLLRFQEGMLPAEIAGTENVSVNAVRLRLSRAVQWLRRRMKEV